MENFEALENAQKLTLKIDVEEKSSCERHVNVEVSREDIEKRFDLEYAELQENAAIPGFRAGKAPLGMVSKKYAAEFVDENISASAVHFAV